MRRFALGLVLTTLTSVATAECLPIFGTVQLAPDKKCTVASLYDSHDPTVVFLGEVGAPPEQACFSVELKLGGILPARGFAGLTAESSPVPIYQGSFERSLLTARSTFKLGRTQFYAAEIIIESRNVDDPDTQPIVSEQSIITGTNGRGLYRNASGYFNILGNSIGERARVSGEICTP